MRHQPSGASWIIALLITLALLCSSAAHALTSDDFNPSTPEPNPSWRFYDPLNTTAGNDSGESSLTFDGTNALISIPAGSNHDLWLPPNNRAPRLLQPATNTDFSIEVKFDAILNAATQEQGIIVQESDNTYLRFDLINNGTATPRLYVAYVNGATNTTTTHRSSVALPVIARDQYRNFPKYRRVIRAGNQWTYRYSYDRTTWTDVVTFTQALTVTEVGVFAGTTGANPALLSSVDYFMDLSAPLTDNDVWFAPEPVITAWYNYSQPLGQFGQPGTSQTWANILGSVFSNVDLSALTYKINNGAEHPLTFGPDTQQATRTNGRLERTGDFNVEIDPNDLNIGSNSIELRATDSNGRVTTRLIPFDYEPAAPGAWPLPYTANWQATSITNIENTAHIVDGKWRLTSSGIRTDQTGYDRAIAIGDMDWPTNYEVTSPITFYNNAAGVGIALGWQGHEGVQSPRIEWPLQAMAWIYRPVSSPLLEIMTYGGLEGWEVIQASQSIAPVTLNTPYMLKFRSESLGNGTSRVYIKFWRQSLTEPAAWNLNADVPTRPGSVLLVAYQGDVAFGNVSVVPVAVATDTTPPVISAVQATDVTSTSATVTWTTDEASSSLVNYGLTSSYGSNSNDTALVTTHSRTLTGLTPNTLYHYRVSSTDASSNAASSADFTFTTAAASGSPSGLVSDGFNSGTLDSRWTFYDPLANSSRSMTGTQASISVPAGSAHDLWTNALNAPRIRQAANNADFDVVVKFDSALSARYQMQGLTAEQNNTNLLRFSFHSDGSVTRLFSASFVNGTATQRISTVITAGVPLYLRVQRVGNQWTASYSYNGTTWTVAGSYSFALTVSSVGLFAGNSGSPVPAHTALIDSFTVDGSAPPGGGDTTPPVISAVQATDVTSTSATVTWTTDEASSSLVNYGLTSSYGSNSSDTALVTTHSRTLTGLTPNTLYHYRVNSTDASSNAASSADFTFTTAAASGSPSGLMSDGFNTATLDPRWTFYDPLANSSRSMTGTQAAISVPTGSAHDLWTNAMNAPRIRQAANNADFDVVVKFDSALSARYQMQGLTAEQNNTNLLRFSFHSDGSVTRLFSASFVNGTATQRLSTVISAGVPLYLRVQRVGNQWTASYSYNGTTWTVAGSYSFALTVSSVGLFAGNSGSPVPAHTAVIDSFTVDGSAP